MDANNTQNPPVNNVEDVSTPKPGRKKTLLIIIIIGSILLCGICSVIVGIFLLNSWSEDPLEPVLSNNTYSVDQNKFIDEFGPPESFNISFVIEKGETQKIEIWKYIELDEIFTFNNGEFINRTHYYFDHVDGVEIYNLELEPEDFYHVKTRTDLDEILGTGPSATTEIEDPDSGDTSYYYEYDKWLHALEADGGIVSIDQKAYVETNNSLELDSEAKG